jgi:hypothetical protein
VTLAVQDGTTVHVNPGEEVQFTVKAATPPGAGSFVDVSWDFEGTGAFADHVPLKKPVHALTLHGTHRYEKSGTYFAVVLIASQRDGDTSVQDRHVRNVARVRVEVGRWDRGHDTSRRQCVIEQSPRVDQLTRASSVMSTRHSARSDKG